MAMDSPKLSAIRSSVSIPRSVFRAGNNAKTRMYPGMNRMKGNPRSVRAVVSIESKEIGSNAILQSIQTRISSGYFDDDIFMLSVYTPRMVIIFFPTIMMKMMRKR